MILPSLYASSSTYGPDSVPVLTVENGETSNTFTVPTDAEALVVNFVFHEIASGLVKIRLQESYLNLGSFAADAVEPSRDGFFGDIRVIISNTDTDTSQVKLVVPKSWYATGRLSVAFAPGIAVESFRIDAVSTAPFYPLGYLGPTYYLQYHISLLQ